MKPNWMEFSNAMNRARSILRNILLWTYGRGSWQYDLMCLVILAFIFLTPTSFFKENRSLHPKRLTTPPAQSTNSSLPDQPSTPRPDQDPNTKVHP